MSNDSMNMNQIHTDPDWVRTVDEVTRAAAKDLGCMVVLIAVQEHGKAGVSLDGVPASGPLADLAQDVPNMLMSLAAICALQDKQGTRQ